MTALKFRRRQETVEAIQYDGSSESAKEIIEWFVKESKDMPSYEVKYGNLYLSSNGHTFIINKGTFLFNRNGVFGIKSSEFFDKEYECIDDRVKIDNSICEKTQEALNAINNPGKMMVCPLCWDKQKINWVCWTDRTGFSYHFCEHSKDFLEKIKEKEDDIKNNFPLWHKQLEIGDTFLGQCTKTNQEVEFAVIGYDREKAMLRLAILSPTFPVYWKIIDGSFPEHLYPCMIVNLWDKGLRILKYHTALVMLS